MPLAKVVVVSDEFDRSAVSWVETGVLPDWPTIAGYTPASLTARNNPMQVCTTLVALSKDPENAKDMLRRYLPC